MKILSLFDGIGAGRVALERCNIIPDVYYSSEVDKYAISIMKYNYPNTIHLGDVRNIDYSSLGNIDLVMGGSPCQSFSFAGKMKGMSTKDSIEIYSLEHYLELKNKGFEFEGQSYLFWEFVYAVKTLNPKYFFLENVRMEKRWELIISKALNIHPIVINSNLVSAQNRERFYWTNIGVKSSGLFGELKSIIEQPKDKGILLKDVLESDVDNKYYINQKTIENFNNLSDLPGDVLGGDFRHDEGFRWRLNGKSGTLATKGASDNSLSGIPLVKINDFIKIDKKGNIKHNQNKASCFTAGANSGGNHSDMDLIAIPQKKYNNKALNKTIDINNIKNETCLLDCYNKSVQYDKSITITTRVNASNNTFIYEPKVVDYKIRRLTPIECERLQTFPDNYTKYGINTNGDKIEISNTQRYKTIGNSWTVDVIAHIFKHIEL